jgi:hypothetical protein
MSNKNTQSENELSTKQEFEIDLLQRRFKNKTQRAIRAIQFNLVALTAVVGIFQFGDPGGFEIEGWFLIGGGLLGISGVCSFISVALNGAPLPVEANNSEGFDPAALGNEYRRRNRLLEKLMAGALVTGGAGIIILTLKLLEIIKVERGLPLTGSIMIVVALLLGSVLIGRYWADP